MAKEVIRIRDEFYIRSSSHRIDVRTRVLKQADAFAVFDRFGDFHDGTRGLENTTWFLRAAERGAVIEVLPDILMYRRVHLDSATRRNPSEFYQNYFLPILKEWRDYQRRRANG